MKKFSTKVAKTNSMGRGFCFFLRNEIAILVVIAFHAVAATPDGEFGENKHTNFGNPYRRYNNRSEMEELYSPYNPLWREEQIYTGERRGPVTDPSTLRRPRRRIQRTNPPSYTPLGPSIQDVDDVSSNYYSEEFPLQSADIGSVYSRSNDIDSGYSQEPSVRRKLSFPIEFRRKRGRVNIGHSSESQAPHRLLASEATASESQSPKVKSSKAPVPHSNNGGAKKLLNHSAVRVSSDKARDGQISLSLDPFSLVTLLQHTATGVVGVTSVYVGTLKLLGPMILAKHCLTTVGNIINDRYRGRITRKASFESLSYSGEGTTPKIQDDRGAARAVARTLFQILCMSCAGRFAGFVLDQTPCLLQPVWICQWWYGVVWLASVSSISFLCQEWISGKTVPSWISIKPTSVTTNFDSPVNAVSTVNTQRRRRDIARPVFRFFQKMSQNPEEWANNLFRSVPQWQIRRNYHHGSKMMAQSKNAGNFELDPLLFPSEWKPLSFVTFLALSRAICQSFCWNSSPSGLVGTLGDAMCMGDNNKQYLILRSFIIQKAIYCEWNRVFVQERRVSLGASISAIGLLALMLSIYAVSTVDVVAAMAMLPVFMARMVGTWITILMSYNHIDVLPETTTWRGFASRLSRSHDQNQGEAFCVNRYEK